MRLRFLRGLDSLFRHYLWIGVVPLFGGLIAMVIARVLWPELPPESYVYGLAGMALGTCIGVFGLRLLKTFIHPWVIQQ
ncbi:MAG: hypothetical protein H7X97_08705, partial [Opitutaceae bacterium]|nr:hypothetical protein [Verrucomicrobiales bacterium]